MNKTFISIAVIIVTASSCCIRRPTHAQSDRLDTHNPFLPIVECIPCSTLKNSPEMVLWSEGWGTSGKWMTGIEPGYNFSHLTLFSDVGTHWWPGGSMSWAHREQVGAVFFDTDWMIRPEIGIGLHQRYYRSGLIMNTPTGEQFIRRQPDFFWQSFAGIRVNIPYSNIVLCLRTFRMQQFDEQKADWNFGIQLGFRLSSAN